MDQILQDGKLRLPPEGLLVSKSGSTRQDRSTSSHKEPAFSRVRRAQAENGHAVSIEGWDTWVMGFSEGIWAVGSPSVARTLMLYMKLFWAPTAGVQPQ